MSFRPVNAAPKQAGVGVSDMNTSLSTTPRVAPHDPSSSSQGRIASSAGSYPLQKQNSNTDSQATARSSSNSTESHRVFTPPIIERSASNGAASSGHESSQESQLLQLSQLAAVQEKMPDVGAVAPRPSVKRMADGAVKENNRTSPGGSPPRPGWHSRNVSGVSIASSTSSRVTELSSELKARLSYAMLKVHNGWQSRTIDEVENLASAAASPASSNSTLPGPAGSSSISPQIQTVQYPPGSSSAAPRPPPQAHQPQSKDDAAARSSASPGAQPAPSSARLQDVPSLAPPVSIQPHRNEANPRRNSNPKHTSSLLSPTSHQNSPHTPALPSLNISRDPRAARAAAAAAAAAADPVVISPTHNNREKDAMEALLFMSSPGNSANMKNYYPASQPVSHLRNGTLAVPSAQRTALPTSAPKRKSLPNGRPTHSSQPLPAAHSPKKRVGFGRSPSAFSEMDIDDPASPRRHAMHARPPAHSPQKTNGTAAQARHSMPPTMEVSRPPPHQPRPRFSYEDLDRVLDQVAAEDPSSESESEIELPTRRAGAGMRS